MKEISKPRFNFAGNVWTITVKEDSKIWVEQFNTYEEAEEWIKRQKQFCKE